jgi:DNA-binding NarL/FixJ family response regulator
MGRPIRILLVEDNSVFREALELLLGLRADIEIVASVGDGAPALPATLEHHPDNVLMDTACPASTAYRRPRPCARRARVAVITSRPRQMSFGRASRRRRRRVPDGSELDEIADAIARRRCVAAATP